MALNVCRIHFIYNISVANASFIIIKPDSLFQQTQFNFESIDVHLLVHKHRQSNGEMILLNKSCRL